MTELGNANQIRKIFGKILVLYIKICKTGKNKQFPEYFLLKNRQSHSLENYLHSRGGKHFLDHLATIILMYRAE